MAVTMSAKTVSAPRVGASGACVWVGGTAPGGARGGGEASNYKAGKKKVSPSLSSSSSSPLNNSRPPRRPPGPHLGRRRPVSWAGV